MLTLTFFQFRYSETMMSVFLATLFFVKLSLFSRREICSQKKEGVKYVQS